MYLLLIGVCGKRIMLVGTSFVAFVVSRRRAVPCLGNLCSGEDGNLLMDITVFDEFSCLNYGIVWRRAFKVEDEVTFLSTFCELVNVMSEMLLWLQNRKLVCFVSLGKNAFVIIFAVSPWLFTFTLLTLNYAGNLSDELRYKDRSYFYCFRLHCYF